MLVERVEVPAAKKCDTPIKLIIPSGFQGLLSQLLVFLHSSLILSLLARQLQALPSSHYRIYHLCTLPLRRSPLALRCCELQTPRCPRSHFGGPGFPRRQLAAIPAEFGRTTPLRLWHLQQMSVPRLSSRGRNEPGEVAACVIEFMTYHKTCTANPMCTKTRSHPLSERRHGKRFAKQQQRRQQQQRHHHCLCPPQ